MTALFLFVLLPGMISQAQSASFPNDFAGRWKGNLEWKMAGKPTQVFSMQLNILPADSTGQYTWQIIYGENNKDVRPYLLKPVDTAKGHWLIDEKNGIILDSYAFGNCLQGAFTVGKNTIVDNYCLDNGRLRVEFFSIRLGEKKQSGNGTEDSPFVDSYRIGSYQAGFLEKIK